MGTASDIKQEQIIIVCWRGTAGRSQFKDCANRVTFRDKAFFNGRKIIQRRWIVLAQCNIDGVHCGEFGDLATSNGGIAESTEVPGVFMVATLI